MQTCAVLTKFNESNKITVPVVHTKMFKGGQIFKLWLPTKTITLNKKNLYWLHTGKTLGDFIFIGIFVWMLMCYNYSIILFYFFRFSQKNINTGCGVMSWRPKHDKRPFDKRPSDKKPRWLFVEWFYVVF